MLFKLDSFIATHEDYIVATAKTLTDLKKKLDNIVVSDLYPTFSIFEVKSNQIERYYSSRLPYSPYRRDWKLKEIHMSNVCCHKCKIEYKYNENADKANNDLIPKKIRKEVEKLLIEELKNLKQ